MRNDSLILRVLEEELLQVAEMGNLFNTGTEGTKGRADFRVAMLHAVEDEQAIYLHF